VCGMCAGAETFLLVVALGWWHGHDGLTTPECRTLLLSSNACSIQFSQARSSLPPGRRLTWPRPRLSRAGCRWSGWRRRSASWPGTWPRRPAGSWSCWPTSTPAAARARRRHRRRPRRGYHPGDDHPALVRRAAGPGPRHLGLLRQRPHGPGETAAPGRARGPPRRRHRLRTRRLRRTLSPVPRARPPAHRPDLDPDSGVNRPAQAEQSGYTRRSRWRAVQDHWRKGAIGGVAGECEEHAG